MRVRRLPWLFNINNEREDTDTWFTSLQANALQATNMYIERTKEMTFI